MNRMSETAYAMAMQHLARKEGRAAKHPAPKPPPSLKPKQVARKPRVFVHDPAAAEKRAHKPRTPKSRPIYKTGNRVADFIRENPGMTKAEICGKLNLTEGALRHALNWARAVCGVTIIVEMIDGAYLYRVAE